MKENNFSRTLTKRNSLYLGLSSMIGAGLFYNLAPTSKSVNEDLFKFDI